MAWYKRLFMFLFGLAGILSLAALSLSWVGPWTSQVRSLILESSWCFIMLEILVCITGVGLLGCVLVSLFAPRNPKDTVVAEVGGSKITITRTAIISQARHIIEADGTCAVASVRVRMGKRGNIRVNVKVTPHLPVNVIDRGTILHSELEQGLAKVCGDCVRSIGIMFTEPEQRGTLSTYVDTDDNDQDSSQSQSSYGEDGITVPLTGGAHADAVAPSASEESQDDDSAFANKTAELAIQTTEAVDEPMDEGELDASREV